jgi:hypothetical protein
VVRRIDGQPVTASMRDGQPAGFTWREQDHAVLGVREHWVISSQWWQRGGPDAGVLPDREYWRVEASPGPGAPVMVCELAHDTASGAWLLARIW